MGEMLQRAGHTLSKKEEHCHMVAKQIEAMVHTLRRFVF
jgi:hypothetical protein